MTRSEAQQELSTLEPLESAAWQEVVCVDDTYHQTMIRLEAERQVAKAEADQHGLTARQVWLPLHKRKQQLKSFLEISG